MLTTNRIYDRLGKQVMSGKGLRPVLRYVRTSPVNVISCKPIDGGDRGQYAVTFYFDNGASCSTWWQDWRVLCDWLTARKSWGVNRLTFHTTMQGDILTEDHGWNARIKRIQKAGTVVTTHNYQDVAG
jgi:hypothetical protein